MSSSDEQDILIAKLALIGASITTIGDGVATVAAALALEALEKQQDSATRLHRSDFRTKAAGQQLDYYIHELMHIRQLF